MQMDMLTTGESGHPDETFDPDTVFSKHSRWRFQRFWHLLVCDDNNSNTQISFKVDTGAEVTAISESTWQKLKNTTQLSKTKQQLYSPDHLPLDVNGMITLSLSLKENVYVQPVFII